MQVYPNRFSQELNNGLKPCYLIFGDEPQQKFDIIDVLRSQARAAGFNERTVLVADKEFSWNQLLDATQSMSLFSDKQLIELELPSGKPGTEGSKILQSVAPMLDDNTLLLVHGPRIGKDVQKAKWFKVLDAVGVHSICYPLEGKHLTGWLQEQLRGHALTASPAGIQLIADFCEGNLLAAKQEIDKLALLYPGATVTDEQIEAAIVDQSRFTVFQLIDVMLSGEQQRCVKMLYRLESEGIEPNIIIWALLREWQTLWTLKQQLQAGQSVQWQRHGIWRNRQAYYQAALARLSLTQLNQIRDQLQQADFVFKNQTLPRPFVKLCHLCMLFLGVPLHSIPLLADDE